MNLVDPFRRPLMTTTIEAFMPLPMNQLGNDDPSSYWGKHPSPAPTLSSMGGGQACLLSVYGWCTKSIITPLL
jgi:hypothetical protein